MSNQSVTLSINDQVVSVPNGTTILDACKQLDLSIPTLCYLENLTPVNACRICVVELEGSRTLVPACSRLAETNMKIQTDSKRVFHSRKLVFELLASSVDLSLASEEIHNFMEAYEVSPERFGKPSGQTLEGDRDARRVGHHQIGNGQHAETVGQPVKIHDEMYVRDYSKCILCYKCVEACGEDAQNTFAISVAGRGFDARISTEFNTRLDDSACVYCGNCIGVCPTSALMFKSEYDRRSSGTWNDSKQTVTQTVCSYCGVGCNLELHVQENEIVKVTSPQDHDVTNGHLCIKGRFGWKFV